jgi:hypothetical protein
MHISLDSELGRQRRLNQIGETINSIATPVAAYSLRSLTGGDPLAVRVRRSSNDASAEKDFTVSGINSGALLNHINEDVITEQSDFTSGVDGYAKDSHGSVAREATYEGKSDVLNYTHTGGRFAFRKTTIALDRTSSYTIAFEYYADTAFNNQVWGVENAFPSGGRPTISSNSPTVVSDAWTSVTINVPNGRTTGVRYLVLRIEDHSAGSTGDDYGTTTNGSVRVKNIVVTQTTGSGFVTTWYDQSGNSNNATQTDTDKQPAIASNGSLLVDSAGLPEIDFDGTDDCLTSSSYSRSGEDLPLTMISVFDQDAAGVDYIVALNKTDNNAFDRILLRTDVFEYGRRATDNVNKAASGSDPDVNTKYVFTAINAGTTSSGFVNGSSIFSGVDTDVNTQALDQIDIGANNGDSQAGSNPFDGQIQEIIIYETDQSSNRTALETNIMNHYSIS